MKKLLLAVSALLGLAALPARAEIALSQIIIDNAPADPLVHDVELSNIGPDKAYVEVTVYRINHPGVYPMERQSSNDPSELGLIATPSKLVLGGDSARLIRLIMLNPPDEKEHIWRVSVVPKVGELEPSQTGVKIVVGYEMLVMQRPKELHPDLKVERQGKSLVATNIGNTNVLVTSLSQCTAKDDCQKTAGTRIYPGRTERMTLPLDAPVEAAYQTAGRNWSERYP